CECKNEEICARCALEIAIKKKLSRCLDRQKVINAINIVQITKERKRKEWDKCINFIKKELKI
ncbi:hypothetical protein KKB54_04140, partial [bacterium]|nr:hypothetical protein [bacterium]